MPGETTTATAPTSAPQTAGNAAPADAKTGTATAPEGSAPGPAQAAAEAIAEVKHKLKIGGEEKELPLSEILKLAQKGEGADRKFNEAAAVRKEMERIINALPQDPVGAIAQLMGDKSKAARAVLDSMLRDPEVREELELAMVERLKYEGMPEDQRKKVDEERDLRAKAKRLEEIEREQEERQGRELEQQAHAHFAQRFSSALGEAKVPVNEHTMARMAIHAERAIAKRTKTTMAELAQKVRAELVGDVGGYLGGLDIEALADFLGEEKLAGLRKRDIEKLKSSSAAPVQRTPPSASNGARPAKKAAQKEAASDFFRRLRSGS